MVSNAIRSTQERLARFGSAQVDRIAGGLSKAAAGINTGINKISDGYTRLSNRIRAAAAVITKNVRGIITSFKTLSTQAVGAISGRIGAGVDRITQTFSNVSSRIVDSKAYSAVSASVSRIKDSLISVGNTAGNQLERLSGSARAAASVAISWNKRIADSYSNLSNRVKTVTGIIKSNISGIATTFSSRFAQSFQTTTKLVSDNVSKISGTFNNLASQVTGSRAFGGITTGLNKNRRDLKEVSKSSIESRN